MDKESKHYKRLFTVAEPARVYKQVELSKLYSSVRRYKLKSRVVQVIFRSKKMAPKRNIVCKTTPRQNILTKYRKPRQYSKRLTIVRFSVRQGRYVVFKAVRITTYRQA